jgi:uncharacterized membrane protein (UPF0127 family)
MRCSAAVKAGQLGAFILVVTFCSACAAESSEKIPLHIGKHAFEVEVAATPQQREHGLMQRDALPANGGMLFVFEQAGRHCFWMRNTPLPLSIAFAGPNGRIINLADMQPLTDTFHCANADARYALEVSQGGFQQRGIVPGDQITGLPR